MAEKTEAGIFFESPTIEPIKITDTAAEQLRQILTEKEVPKNSFLRVGVKGGGCSGLSYILDIDEKKDYDDEYEINGVPFILDRRHKLYIEGTVIDFSSGLDNRGFTFDNPNAQTTCGCGSSFST